jgi:hypothetical protein
MSLRHRRLSCANEVGRERRAGVGRLGQKHGATLCPPDVMCASLRPWSFPIAVCIQPDEV